MCFHFPKAKLKIRWCIAFTRRQTLTVCRHSANFVVKLGLKLELEEESKIGKVHECDARKSGRKAGAKPDRIPGRYARWRKRGTAPKTSAALVWHSGVIRISRHRSDAIKMSWRTGCCSIISMVVAIVDEKRRLSRHPSLLLNASDLRQKQNELRSNTNRSSL